MNEQQESERLDAFIAGQLGSRNGAPSSEPEALAARIIRLESASAPDPQFVARLQGRLKHEEKDMSKRTYRRSVAAVAAVMVFAVVGVSFRTELRALAQEIIDLFRPAESDERTVEAIFGGIQTASATVEAVESDVMPSEVRYPAFIPDTYALSFTLYDEQTGSELRYACSKNRHWMFSLRQFDTPYQIEVGESAVIETIVLDNGIQAQYVRGTWESGPMTIEEAEATSAGSTIIVTQVWDNESEVQYLYWQEGGTYFSLGISGWSGIPSFVSNCDIDKETFVAIANSIE